MTLPKKDRRTIQVDGTMYHYRICFNKSERAVIQHESGQGACLFVFPHAMMRPRHVADAIRFGMRRGWTPGSPGNDVWLAFDASENDESLLEYISNDDFRVATYHTFGELPENVRPDRYADTRKWYDREISPDNID